MHDPGNACCDLKPPCWQHIHANEQTKQTTERTHQVVYGLVTLSSMRKSCAVLMLGGRLVTVTDTVVVLGTRGSDVAPCSGLLGARHTKAHSTAHTNTVSSDAASVHYFKGGCAVHGGAWHGGAWHGGAWHGTVARSAPLHCGAPLQTHTHQKLEAKICRPLAPTVDPALCVVAKTVTGVASGVGLCSCPMILTGRR